MKTKTIFILLVVIIVAVTAFGSDFEDDVDTYGATESHFNIDSFVNDQAETLSAQTQRARGQNVKVQTARPHNARPHNAKVHQSSPVLQRQEDDQTSVVNDNAVVL